MTHVHCSRAGLNQNQNTDILQWSLIWRQSKVINYRVESSDAGERIWCTPQTVGLLGGEVGKGQQEMISELLLAAQEVCSPLQ